MLDLRSFSVLTFDCYGTLVDWEEGLATALTGLLADHGVDASREEVLELHATFEPAIQSGDFLAYREVLAGVVDRFGERYGFRPSAAERRRLAESIRRWPAFPDTADSLRRLARRYRLGVLSNIDDDLFALSKPRLGVELAVVVTAQQVGAYKPSPAHFDEALRHLEVPAGEVLHVAQSLFHDVAPARELGWATVWVNRRAGLEGDGATPPSKATPDLEVADLASLAELADRSFAER